MRGSFWIKPIQPISKNCVIPAQAGIQQGQTLREADKTAILSRVAGDLSITWIPACAGMTG